MPTLDAHAALACRNHAVLDMLLPHCDAHPEWVVTVAFYKAVHLAEAVFKCEDGTDSTEHWDRNERLRRDHQHVWKLYSPLWMASKVARYLECGQPGTATHRVFSTFSAHRSPNQVRNYVSHNLRKIEDWAIKSTGGKVHFTYPPPAPAMRTTP
jgi:hypothetical protein